MVSHVIDNETLDDDNNDVEQVERVKRVLMIVVV